MLILGWFFSQGSKATVFCTKSLPFSSLIRRLQSVLVEAATRPPSEAFQTAGCFCLLRVRAARSDAERACERRRRALSCSALKGGGGPTALHKQSLLLRLHPNHHAHSWTNFSLERNRGPGIFSWSFLSPWLSKFNDAQGCNLRTRTSLM